MKIIIPARGNSKRILNKNIVDLNGQPLISYAIGTSLDITDEVFVSTDSTEIGEIAKEYGAQVIQRPDELSKDSSTTASVIHHFLEVVGDVDCLICVQATSPLLQSHYVQMGIEKFKSGIYNSIISAYKERQFCWNENGTPINFTVTNKPRSQNMRSWYVENGAFYITSKEFFLRENSLIGGNVGFVLMPKIDSIDIDEHEDLELARIIMSSENH